MPVQRKHTEVAVGILIRADGALLLTTRPPDKVYAGYWEFPGGKIEAGETVRHHRPCGGLEGDRARLPARAGALALVQGARMDG